MIIVLALGYCGNAVGADQSTSSTERNRLIASYTEVAFVTDKDRLLKPQTDKPTNMMLQCVAKEGCDLAVAEIGKYVKAPWIGIRQTINFDP